MLFLALLRSVQKWLEAFIYWVTTPRVIFFGRTNHVCRRGVDGCERPYECPGCVKIDMIGSLRLR